MGRNTSILGMSLASATDEELAMIHGGLGAGLADGTLKPVVGRELPLKDAPAAHVAVMKPGAYGKIVLIP
jgi:NADPH2:quinone reductase